MSLHYRLPFPAAPPSSSALRLFLLLHVLFHGGVSATCPSSCANLARISYPFGAALSCGAPGFVLDCSGPVAHWTLPLQPETFRFPVLDITNYFSHGSITLNLAASQPNIQNPSCTLYSTDTLDDNNPSSYAFAGVNLFLSNRLAVLNFSSQDIYLFFGCDLPKALANSLVEADSSYCIDYRNNCAQTSTDPCVQLITPTQELNLSHLAQNLTCTHYKSFLAVTPQPWNYSSIQLSWSNLAYNSDCTACQESGGTCGYDMQPNDNFSFRCFVHSSPKGCIGNLCTTGAKVAALGVPSMVLVLVSIIVLCSIRRNRKGSVRSGVPSPSSSSHTFISGRSKSVILCRYGSQQVLSKKFSFKELQHATDFFSEDRIIGQGGFGVVYEGNLEDGRKVAVKRLHHDRFTKAETFLNEARILSSLRHKNLVTLYGFSCDDQKPLLLVLEYVSNGTLAEHLHSGSVEGLPWRLRLDIACEVAEALSYLHNSVTPPIFHRDVKSSNILLDHNHHAKLSDFGISRIVLPQTSHISTAPQGTPGYFDPLYFKSFQLTDKSDVYSFGIVLLELVSGRLPVDMSRDSEEVNLARFARAKIASGTWCESIVDARIGIHLHPDLENMVGKVLHLACRCVAKRKEKRPRMKDVAEVLAEIRRCGYNIAGRDFPIDVDQSSWPWSDSSPDLSVSSKRFPWEEEIL